MDKKPQASTNDETHKPTDADPAAAKAAVDSLIQQLRAAPGQPELHYRARDRAKAGRWWLTFDRVLVAVVAWALIVLAAVYVAYWR
jgi:hypothetical protein